MLADYKREKEKQGNKKEREFNLLVEREKGGEGGEGGGRERSDSVGEWGRGRRGGLACRAGEGRRRPAFEPARRGRQAGRPTAACCVAALERRQGHRLEHLLPTAVPAARPELRAAIQGPARSSGAERTRHGAVAQGDRVEAWYGNT